MYRVVLSRGAEKDLNKVNKKYKPHIFAALFDLKKRPIFWEKTQGQASKLLFFTSWSLSYHL